MASNFSSVPQQIAHRDFDKQTLSALSGKGVEVVGTQAVPAFEGDRYFSGTAYQIVIGGETVAIRTHAQLRTMASSSWHSGEFLQIQED